MSKQVSELLYRREYSGKGGEPETPEFMIRVFPDEYKQWKKGMYELPSIVYALVLSFLSTDPHSIALVQVVDSFDVFHGKAHAHTGTLERPSNTQLKDAFGSSKFEDVFAFMSEHGHLQPCGRHSNLDGNGKKGMQQQHK